MRIKALLASFAAFALACTFCACAEKDDGGDTPPPEEETVVYENDDILLPDVICDKDNGYDVDPEGKTSSTMALQKAVDDCYEAGGGTVYLPAGKYLVTSRIDLKPYVTVVGDYVSPENYKTEYGTVIIAGVKSSAEDVGEQVNVFRMYGSSGLIGLTFFYPEQYADMIMPYGYTVEIPGGFVDDAHNVFTIKNVTFLNSYKGICASNTKWSTLSSVTHEQLHLVNVRGTVLREGVHITNSSEVGTFSGVSFKPDYWVNAGKDYNAPERDEILSFTRENSVGMILGDLEWQEIRDIELEGYHTGIYFTDGDRATTYHMAFIGSFYNLEITDSVYGIYVERLYEHMGIQFCKAVITASEYAVINNSPQYEGHLQFSYADISGKFAGFNVFTDGNGADEAELITPDTSVVLPEKKVYDCLEYGADKSGKKDCSAAVQAALDEAGENGGGVAYLPAGFYRMEKPVNVPAGVQLRGCHSSVSRDLLSNSRGTMILDYYVGEGADCMTGRALITLEGDNSGVCGFRVTCPEINLFTKVYTPETLPRRNFVVRASGKGNYAKNLYLEGVYNGVDFGAGCENSVVERVMGGIYNVGIRLGGKNQTVNGCLQNSICIIKITPSAIPDFANWGTYATRSNLLHTNVYGLTRYTSKFIILDGAENALLNNVFAFASERLVQADNSTFTAVNLGCDSQPGDSGAMFVLTNSRAVCYNTLRDVNLRGEYIKSDTASVFTVYNRISLIPGSGYLNEGNIVENNQINMFNAMADDAFALDKIWLKKV